MDKCLYRCYKCKFEFERIISGMTSCPRCQSLYVEWLNHKKILNDLVKNNSIMKNNYPKGF